MLIQIQHETVYSYSEPQNHSVQYLRLTPPSVAGQDVRRWRLDGPGKMPEWRDAFGNLVHVLVVDQPHQEVTVRSLGEVKTSDTKGVTPIDGDSLPSAAYLRGSNLTEPAAEIGDFCAGHRAAVDADRLDGLHRLMTAVRDAMDYRKGVSDATTTAAEALAAGSGVCQDHAHVFIACVRLLGVPARYVSGYLVSSDSEEQEASHAWADAFVPDLGWVGFDVANRVCPTDAYVRMAVGLDYLDAAPIRGLRLGGGDEDLTVSVTVRQQATQMQA